MKEPGFVAVYDRDDRDLQTVGFKGFICKDQFNFELKEHKRMTKYDGNFLSISDVQYSKYPSFETGYSGFVGFEPYTKDESRKGENFMWQLQQKGLIEHLTVAFYLENGDTDPTKAMSVIKFGAMDKQGLLDDAKQDNGKTRLRVIRTKNKTTWDMDLEYVKLSMQIGKNEYIGRDMTIRMEP